MIAGFRKEIRPMLRLAAPLAMAELGWMSMGFVDTVMAGRLGAAAIGAGSLGGMLFYPIAICGTGMLAGMDTLVAQAFGARDDAGCRRTLVQGVWIAMGVAPIVALLLALTIPLLRAIGTNPRVMELLGPFVHALLWGVLPLLFYTAFRRYLQAMNIVRPITFAVVSANLLNFAGNWLFMYGNWGAPRLGLEGSGYSTSLSRVYIALVLLIAVLQHERKHGNLHLQVSWRPQWALIRRLLALGFPSAMQILAEGAVFGVVTVMAARFDEVSLAAHSIAVNVISITYMVPLGISSAAAVRVGQAAGSCARCRIHGVRRPGTRVRSALDRAPVHTGSGRDRGGRGPAAHRGTLRDLRWHTGGRHGGAARTWRYTDSGVGTPRRILDYRFAGRVPLVFLVWLGCYGHLGGPDGRPHCRRTHPAGGVAPRNESGAALEGPTQAAVSV